MSREALATAARCAEQSSADRPDVVRREVQSCLQALGDARPEMIPIRHWVDRLTREIERVGREVHDPSGLKSDISAAANRLIALVETANRRAAANAVASLSDGSVVFTASYSQTVVDACRAAGQSGRLRRLLIAESADPSGHRYGQLLADAVDDTVQVVEVISDAEAPGRVGEADRVWLGADTVLPDGSLLKGMPSLAIARAGRLANRPVELIGESAKIEFPTDDRPQTVGQLPSGPAGMERVPGEYITRMFTEDGPVEWPLRAPASSPSVNSGTTGPGTPPVPDLVARIAERLVARGEVVAVAESSAGGLISDWLTNRPGCSAWYVGGIVAYSSASKCQTTGVSADALREHGAVSIETARGLAQGAIRLFAAAWGIGETGIAGPQSGRRSSKPAGYACLAVVGPDDRGQAIEVNTGLDDRLANKEAFAIAALRLLLTELERA